MQVTNRTIHALAKIVSKKPDEYQSVELTQGPHKGTVLAKVEGDFDTRDAYSQRYLLDREGGSVKLGDD